MMDYIQNQQTANNNVSSMLPPATMLVPPQQQNRKTSINQPQTTGVNQLQKSLNSIDFQQAKQGNRSMTREVVNLNRSRDRLPEISNLNASKIIKPIN